MTENACESVQMNRSLGAIASLEKPDFLRTMRTCFLADEAMVINKVVSGFRVIAST